MKSVELAELIKYLSKLQRIVGSNCLGSEFKFSNVDIHPVDFDQRYNPTAVEQCNGRTVELLESQTGSLMLFCFPLYGF